MDVHVTISSLFGTVLLFSLYCACMFIGNFNIYVASTCSEYKFVLFFSVLHSDLFTIKLGVHSTQIATWNRALIENLTVLYLLKKCLAH
jgi:hypothetical protein